MSENKYPIGGHAPGREIIEDILLKTGKHNPEQCSELADLILRDMPKTTHVAKESVEENWQSFWKEIVCNEDGTVNIESVKKELADFSFILEQVPKVYCHITGSRMSKVMYHADTVIGVADQYFEEQLEEAVKDEVGEQDGFMWIKDALKWSKEAIEFANKEFECPEHFVETWGNLYMNVLHAIDQALDESAPASNSEQITAALQKFVSMHETGLLPNKFTYEEGKKALEG